MEQGLFSVRDGDALTGNISEHGASMVLSHL